MPSSSGPRWLIHSSAPATQFWSGSASRARARQPAIPHIEVPNGLRELSGHRSYGGSGSGVCWPSGPAVWAGSLFALFTHPPHRRRFPVKAAAPPIAFLLSPPHRRALLGKGDRALHGIGGEEHGGGDLVLPRERLGLVPVGGFHHDPLGGGEGKGCVLADLDGERARIGKCLTRHHQAADQ